MDQFASKVAPYLPMGTFFAFQTVTQLILPTNGTLMPSPLSMLQAGATSNLTYFNNGTLADQVVSVDTGLLGAGGERSAQSNNCNSAEFAMVIAWLALMCLVCFFLAFTDTAIDAEGGGVPIFVLPNSYWKPPGSKMVTPEYDAKFRPGGSGAWCWVDVSHGLLSTITLLTMSLLTPPVYTCFFSQFYVPSVVTRAVPAMVVTIATAIFGFFKRSRDGWGYNPSPQARDSDDLFTYLSSGSNNLEEAKLKVMEKKADIRMLAAKENAKGITAEQEEAKELEEAAQGKTAEATEKVKKAQQAVTDKEAALKAATAALKAATKQHAEEVEKQQDLLKEQAPSLSPAPSRSSLDEKGSGSPDNSPGLVPAPGQGGGIPVPLKDPSLDVAEQARKVGAAKAESDAAERQVQQAKQDLVSVQKRLNEARQELRTAQGEEQRARAKLAPAQVELDKAKAEKKAATEAREEWEVVLAVRGGARGDEGAAAALLSSRGNAASMDADGAGGSPTTHMQSAWDAFIQLYPEMLNYELRWKRGKALAKALEIALPDAGGAKKK